MLFLCKFLCVIGVVLLLFDYWLIIFIYVQQMCCISWRLCCCFWWCCCWFCSPNFSSRIHSAAVFKIFFDNSTHHYRFLLPWLFRLSTSDLLIRAKFFLVYCLLIVQSQSSLSELCVEEIVKLVGVHWGQPVVTAGEEWGWL